MLNKELRSASVKRVSKETEISINLQLDKPRKIHIDTPVQFFNHMLEAMAFHGRLDLDVKARGDIEVDPHHLVEDTGIVFGECLQKIFSLGPVNRFGSAKIPMDDALSEVVLDAGGRAYLHYDASYDQQRISDFDVNLVREFMMAVSVNAQINLHAIVHYGKNSHHMVESLFKAFGRSILEAYAKSDDEMSTKGVVSESSSSLS